MFKLKQFRGLLLIVMLASLTFLVSSTSLAIKPPPENYPPVVDDIPDHTIFEGGTFHTITLDAFVEDAETPDAQIVWTASGNSELGVSIVDRVATITIPDDWTGDETITFTATDEGYLSDQNAATFTVTTECVWDPKYPVSPACGEVCELCTPDETNPYAADPPDCFNYPVGWSICAETILKKLGHVGLNPTEIEFLLADIDMIGENFNPQCNSGSAQGTTFGGPFAIDRTITEDEVAKNGNAVISDLCFTYDFFHDLIRANPQWFNCWLDLASFEVGFKLSQNGIVEHVIWAQCVPSGDCDPDFGAELNCTTICDSQNGPNVPPCCDPDGLDPDLPACPEPE